MLTPEIKAEMARLRTDKGYSYQAIADTFGVSKTRVQIILNPATHENQKRFMREYQQRLKEQRNGN